MQEMQLRMHPSILGSGSSDKLWTTFPHLLVSVLQLSNKRHALQTPALSSIFEHTQF